MLLLVVGCVFLRPEVHTECAPVRLSTGRAECDGISLCIETKIQHYVAAPQKVSTRSWFQTAEGVNIQLASASRCPGCEPSLKELVCADVDPQQSSRR